MRHFNTRKIQLCLFAHTAATHKPKPQPRCYTRVKIQIKTPVAQSAQQVDAGFTRDLLEKLTPPFPPVRILRYDGNTPGDEVHLQLGFLLFTQTWVSEITARMTGPTEWGFVDEGRKLPFFLGYWQHKHRIVVQGTGAVIIDDITFHAPLNIFDFLLWPVLYAQFAARRPLYRQVFGLPQ